jgi:hypothetical protein
MISSPVVYLILHGSIIILIGLLVGLPLRSSILRKAEAKASAWRVAHSVLIMDGLLMVLVGMLLPRLSLDQVMIGASVWSSVASGYGFAVAFTVGAWKGFRGLSARPFGLNTVLFVAHVVGALGSFIGMAIVFYGLLKAVL